MDRRGFLKTLLGTGVALYLPKELITNTYISLPGPRALAYANRKTSLEILKELYSDDAFVLKGLVYRNNPFLSMMASSQADKAASC